MRTFIVLLICCGIVAANSCKESAASIWSTTDSCVLLIQVTSAGEHRDYRYNLLYRLRGGLGCSWGPKDFQVPSDCGFSLEVGRSYIVGECNESVKPTIFFAMYYLGVDYYFNFVRLYD
ncbi:hypothetical protein ANCCAN_12337 [Ancylostoma caninum]|uniref:Transthyretin-like family protein n=1 Tax=Ancylostoma caninum TaxID=29170 RepID=A0A368GBJ3_ANCCA|nr:hypothetical protein ANCCAN_12337 [Ancylostoma caninum]